MRVGWDDAEPAWLWVGQVVRTRTDWWPSVGPALQHAAHDGGDLARTALADLLANERATAVLLEWTAPLAGRWPEATATRSILGWGPGLADVVRDQQRFLEAATAPEREVILARGREIRLAALRDERDLEALLGSTSRAGWPWLGDEVLFRPWVRDALPRVAARMEREAGIRALLGWLSAGWDPWRFADLLDRWRSRPPPWSTLPARGGTLGDAVLRLLDAVRAAPPPDPDLPSRP